jgi:hypothetical protein
MNQHLERAWRRTLRRIGRPGLLALALLVPALAMALWLPRLHRQADSLRATLATQVDAAARPADPVVRRLSSGERATQFMAAVPPLSQSASDLSEVFAIAKRRNLALPKGDYVLKPEPNTALVAYSVSLPVRNDYSALKGFAADVLEALPHASMDELHMARSDAGTAVLDAVIRFTFLYRSQ